MMPHVFAILAQAAEAPSRGVLSWLLGVRKIDPTDPSIELGWEHALPMWVWVLIVAAAIGVAVISYRRLLGHRGGRSVMAVVRALILLLLVALLAGPMLVLPRENVEEDQLIMLVDRSASVSVKDVPTAGDEKQRITRQQQLHSIVETHGELWKQLATHHQLEWLGFGERVVELGGAKVNTEPRGQATAIRSAIHESIRRAAGKPISGIVLLTDGRSSEPLGPEVTRMLTQLGVAVYPVPLGAAKMLPDLALQRIDAPDRAFINDTVPITVTVGATAPPVSSGDQPGDTGPAPAASAPAPGTVVRLIDTATGQPLDERRVEKFGEPIRLLHTPRVAGQASWRVQLFTPEQELIEENNVAPVELTLVDRPIRVLYVEGYPRWEYRYLKSMMVRETSIASSIMLISADRTFAQEGNIPLKRLPRSEEEIAPYDVIVIGDVPAGFFSAEQQRLISEQVSRRGAGLLWIGGELDTPGSYATSPLAALLPIAGPPQVTLLETPIAVRPTPAAEALGVLRLLAPEGEISGSWPKKLPHLMWGQQITSLKPAGEALAIDEHSGYGVVVRMRYGAGQSLYVATDDTWRWRYGRGELYFEQFWMQLIRLLARERLQSAGEGGDRAILSASHRRASTGDTLTLELRITDQTLLEKVPASIEVEVIEDSGEAAGPNAAGAGRREVLTLMPTDEKGQYRGLWQPRAAGKMNLRVITPSLADLGLRQSVQVERVDDELRYPATDHALLADLAAKTGGVVLQPEDLTPLLSKVPDRERRTAADISEPLWNTPLAFALILLLLTGEWIGRKMLGLA